MGVEAMAEFVVPLILRGEVIDIPEVDFGGRRSGVPFSTPDVAKRIDALPLATPSSLADLYDLTFDDILDYLAGLGDRLSFGQNPYLQEAFELSRRTSGLTEGIL